MGTITASKDIKEKFLKPMEEAAYENGVNLETYFRDWVTVSTYTSTGCLMGLIGEAEECRKRLDYGRDILKKYNEKGSGTFLTLSENLRSELEQNPRDILGEIYQSIQANNRSFGQHFTPIQIAELMAQLTMNGDNPKDFYTISDPCCGSGVMSIAAHNVLKEQGLTNRQFGFVGQDIDSFCCYMAYLQLELLGVDAVIYNDNSLLHPYGPNMEISKIYTTSTHILNYNECMENQQQSA